MKDDRPARKVIKGLRWLLMLRSRENMRADEDCARVDELLAANRQLMTVCVLKDDSKRLVDYGHACYAGRFWGQRHSRQPHRATEGVRAQAQRVTWRGS